MLMGMTIPDRDFPTQILLVKHKMKENSKGTNQAPQGITMGKDKVIIGLSFLE
jgi:hypothetical protein